MGIFKERAYEYPHSHTLWHIAEITCTDMHDIARKNASSLAIVGEERRGTLERYGLVALERLSSMKSRKMQRYATTDLAHEAQRVGE